MRCAVPEMSVQKPHRDDRWRDSYIVVVRHHDIIDHLPFRTPAEANKAYRSFRHQGYKLFNPKS